MKPMVFSRRNRQPWGYLRRHYLTRLAFNFIVGTLMNFSLSLCGLAQGFVPECQVPFQHIAQKHPIDSQCGIFGNATAPGLRLQDTVKNNFCASTQPIALDFNDFARLQKRVETKHIHFGSEETLITDRTGFKTIGMGSRYPHAGEGTLVRFAGVMATKHYAAWSEAESVNCRLQGADNADIQVSLVPRSGDDLCKSVLVEISPHMRPWQWLQLLELTTQFPLRFTGQLFFDASHKKCGSGDPHELKRASVWEIHPVYSIDICVHDSLDQCDVNADDQWMPLDQWKNNKGLAAKLAFDNFAVNARVHEPLQLEISLRNATNEPSSRKQDTPVAIRITFPSRRVETHSIVIKAGMSSAALTLDLPESGIVQIQAKASELYSTSMVINVAPGASTLWPNSHSAHFQPASYFLSSLSPQTMPHSGAQSPTLGGEHKTRIRIFASPARELMANGSDAATISALVDGDIAHQDIPIQVHSTLGFFEPCDSQEHALSGLCPDTVLVIPKGASSSFVQLQSSHMGDAKISYVPTRQDIVIEDAAQTVQFGPPITRITVKASPPSISLVDNSNILIQLADENGKVYVPARAKRITLTIQHGEGRLESQANIVIAPPNLNAVTSFTPGFWLGEVDLEVAADELESTRLRLFVTPPIWLLLVSVAGGLAGGALAYQQNRQNASLWRIPIGALTGFIFYWAFIFGLFPAKSAVLNPVSDFALSVLGGWVGTNLFALLLKQFGIAT